MRSLSTILVVLSLGTSCSDDGMNPQLDSGNGECVCTAVNVSYDDTTSELGADNVQVALDELAARPAEPPLRGRIQTKVVAFTLSDQPPGGVEKTAACANEARDVVLGGACGFVAPQVTLGSTIINNSANDAKFSCGYNVPETLSANSSVTVVCLTNAK